MEQVGPSYGPDFPDLLARSLSLAVTNDRCAVVSLLLSLSAGAAEITPELVLSVPAGSANSTSIFQLLVAASRERPMPFSVATEAIRSSFTLEMMGRKSSDLEKYHNATKKMKETYVSVSDFIRIDKFNFSSSLDASTNKLQASVPNSASPTTAPLLKLVVNDFPYNFSPDVTHMVLWKVGEGAITGSEIEAAVEELRREGAEECSWWINPPHLKSIKDLDHAHILARKKT